MRMKVQSEQGGMMPKAYQIAKVLLPPLYWHIVTTR